MTEAAKILSEFSVGEAWHWRLCFGALPREVPADVRAAVDNLIWKVVDERARTVDRKIGARKSERKVAAA